MRCLEIGPHKVRIEGFETLDILKSSLVDHVGDATRPPFRDNSFDIVYSSHVIEHIEWDQVEETIGQWARIVKPGGRLEVHTLNASALMKVLIHLDDTGEWLGPDPTWRDKQTHGDPYLWAVGRIMNYPKGGNEFQKHRSLITPNYLQRCFERAGLTDLQPLGRNDMRASRHNAFITFGLAGVKPC